MGWPTATIAETVLIISGGTPKSGVAEYWGGDVEWITPKDMGKMSGIYVSDTARKISQIGLDKSSAKLIPENSVILSTRAPIGHLAINTVPMATNQGCRGLVPKGSLDTKFLYYFLLKSVDLLNDLGSGTTFKELSKSALEKVCVSLPPIPEQKRIVVILDQAFADIELARAKTEQNLKNVRELFESYLDSYFNPVRSNNWERVKIEDACISIIDCINKTAPKVDYQTRYKMIRTTNVRHGLVSLEKVNCVTEDTYVQWTRRQIPEVGDVILTREAPMGEVGMLLSDEKVFLGQRLVSYRTNPEVLNKNFLLLSFQSRDVQKQIESRASGSTVQHMRVPDTKILEIPLPSLQEQELIVEKLEFVKEKTKALIKIYTSKMIALDELKKSILQKAFSGELTKTLDKETTTGTAA